MQVDFRRYFKTVLGAVLTAGLAACGGGGDSGPSNTPVAPTTPVAVTTTNADKAAAAAIAAVTGVGTGTSAIAASTTVAPVPPRTLGRITADTVKRAQLFLSSPQSALAATTSQTYSCALSGTLTISVTDNGSVVTGLSFAFSNCSDYAGETLNGSISLSGVAQTSTTMAGTFSSDLTMVATGLPTMRIAGGFTFNYTYTGTDWSGTISGTSLSIYEGTTTAHTLSSFSFSDSYASSTDTYTSSVNFTLDSTDIGGRVTVATLAPIAQLGSRSFPNQGQFTVTGTGNSKLRATILGDETHAGDDVSIEVDADGNGTYEATLTRDWSVL